ncbi:MAG: hypothetical protein AB8B69_24220 [Chitinophagales bacterium]
MQVFILLTGIGELLVGLLMFLKPNAIPQFAKASPTTRATARMYGAAAISIGVFAVMVGLHLEEASLLHHFLIIYLIFHILVAASVFLAIRVGESADTKIGILHTILAAITAFFLFS